MGLSVRYSVGGPGTGVRQAAADCKALTDGAYSISRLAAPGIYCHRCSCTTRRLLNRAEKSPAPNRTENIPVVAARAVKKVDFNFVKAFTRTLCKTDKNPRDANNHALNMFATRHLVLLVKSDVVAVRFITCSRRDGPEEARFLSDLSPLRTN